MNALFNDLYPDESSSFTQSIVACSVSFFSRRLHRRFLKRKKA